MAWCRCDDLDGSVEDVQPVDLAYRGQIYLLHLGPKNRTALDEAMAPWIEGQEPRGPMNAVSDFEPEPKAPTRKNKARALRTDLAQVRAWATANGYDIKGLGRVPNHVLVAYDAAQ